MAVASNALQRFEIFETFTDEELTEVAGLCSEERHHDGAKLFDEGDSAEKLYLVLEGKVSLEKTVQLGRSGSSRQATVSIQGSGQAVGWSSLVAPQIYTMSGVCIGPTKLLVIESDDMRRFVAQKPEAGVKLMNAIATLVRDRLEATTKTLTYFLSIISHELRSPLAAVENYLEVMLAGYAGELTNKQLRMLERSALRVKDLRMLMSDVLDLARIRPEHIQADFERISLPDIALQSVEDVRLLAREKSVQTCLDIAPEMGETVAAPRRLRQVLTNLLSNAIKFSPEKGRVWLRLVEESDVVRIEVADEGIGIPLDEQEHVFEDFFRARNVGEVGGTGLGLSIVKKIVGAHHGEIWFESPYESGKQGTKFTVVIPKDLATPAMKQEEWEATHA